MKKRNWTEFATFLVITIVLMSGTTAFGQTPIRLETLWENGVVTMPCSVNGFPVRFTFDSISSISCISSGKAMELLKNGRLEKKDFNGMGYPILVNGAIREGTKIRLRKVIIDEIILNDVVVVAMRELDAPLSFGQSVIRRLGTVQIQGGRVSILLGSNQEAVGNTQISRDDEGCDEENYKRKGWLVKRGGMWCMAERAPGEAKVRFYKLHANRGETDKMVALGDLYSAGEGVEQNFAEAYRWYRQAAENGDLTGQLKAGLCLLNGKGVEEDEESGAQWISKAAEAGSAEAQFQLGECFWIGNGTRYDQVEAMRWYTKAAEQGYVKAQCRLGEHYYSGLSVPQNRKEAFHWFKLAAEQGDAEGQYRLGECFAYGFGVDRDEKKGFHWRQKAADQGHIEAMGDIGWCYELGIGVSPSKSKALSWYKKAADLGDESAARRYQDLLHRK